MKSKLLIVDDSATIQKIVAMAFEKEDILVQGSSNGEEAFEKISEFQPDIVVVDIDMPGMTGFELSQKIKESDQFSSIPVLLLRSDFEDFDERLFEKSKANDYLSKPFKSEGIVQKVKQLIEENSPDKPAEAAAVSLSADDLQEESDAQEAASDSDSGSTPVKLSAEDVAEETDADVVPQKDEETPDSAAMPSTDDILDNIMQDAGLPDITESAEPEAVASPPATEDGKDEKGEVTEDAPFEISLDDMLESAEDFLKDVEDVKKAEEEVVKLSTDDVAEEEVVKLSTDDVAEEAVVKLSTDDVAEEAVVKLSTDDVAEEVVVKLSTDDVAESAEPELVTSSPAPVEGKDDKVVVNEAPTQPPEDMSIEELLSSAEELLQDNYLELAKADAAGTGETEISDVLKDVEAFEGRQYPVEEIEVSDAVRAQAFKPAKKLEPAGEAPTSADQMKARYREQTFADLDSSTIDPVDELDAVFNAIQSFQEEGSPEPQDGEEPAPLTGFEGKPDLIRETLSCLSELSPPSARKETSSASNSQSDLRKEFPMSTDPTGDMFAQVVGDHVKRILERSLKDSIAKEISGLSKTIEHSVQEIVKEVTPDIARSVIQKEIEKIKKLEEA